MFYSSFKESTYKIVKLSARFTLRRVTSTSVFLPALNSGNISTWVNKTFYYDSKFARRLFEIKSRVQDTTGFCSRRRSWTVCLWGQIFDGLFHFKSNCIISCNLKYLKKLIKKNTRIYVHMYITYIHNVTVFKMYPFFI